MTPQSSRFLLFPVCADPVEPNIVLEPEMTKDEQDKYLRENCEEALGTRFGRCSAGLKWVLLGKRVRRRRQARKLWLTFAATT